MKHSDHLGKQMVNLITVTFLVAGIFVTVKTQEIQELSTLTAITTDVTSTGIAIYLSATGPIQGEIQSLDEPPTRLYIDLPNTVPRVPAVTDVNFGPVKRVRVALNQSSPPLTRVVIDVERLFSYELVGGLTDRELRILVNKGPQETQQLGISNLKWHRQKLEQLTQLLERTSKKYADGSINITEQQELEIEWDLHETELISLTPSTDFDQLRALLLTTCLIGSAITETLSSPFSTTDIESALAGASMLLGEAERMVSTHSDNVF
tara:strand:+ start:28247 stop:29041 length:795 start_codon:yes stop_codon:yes gene_type:complete